MPREVTDHCGRNTAVLSSQELYVFLSMFWNQGHAVRNHTDIINKLVDFNLIGQASDNVFIFTSRGEAHLQQICNATLPVLQEMWVDGRGQRI